MTMPNTTAGGTRCTSARMRASSGTLGSRIALPLARLEPAIQSMKKPVSSRPGMMPAMNSLPIELLVSEPYTIMFTLGGIRMPSVPPAARLPSEARIE